MRELAPGKINLSLFLGPVRDDGRHELVTVIESVSLADELEISALPGGADEVICEGVGGENLVATALRALRARGWDGPPLQVKIRKRIPIAAGMGGGSADAAALLRAAERFAPVPGDLLELAAELGADVPSQLTPGVTLGTGAGDQVEPRSPLSPHALVIVPQPHRLSTPDVYAEADRLGLPRSQEELAAHLATLEPALSSGAPLPPELLVNDLEPAAISLCPAVGRELDALRAAGADHAMVCGSGPTVAGLCWGDQDSSRPESIAARLGGSATTAVPVSSSTSGTMGD